MRESQGRNKNEQNCLKKLMLFPFHALQLFLCTTAILYFTVFRIHLREVSFVKEQGN